MKAIRQIVSVHNNSFVVVLPPDFKSEKVEVIILPVEEAKEKTKLKNSDKFSGAISKKTAEKLHNHVNQIRGEWERDIF